MFVVCFLNATWLADCTRDVNALPSLRKYVIMFVVSGVTICYTYVGSVDSRETTSPRVPQFMPEASCKQLVYN